MKFVKTDFNSSNLLHFKGPTCNFSSSSNNKHVYIECIDFVEGKIIKQGSRYLLILFKTLQHI